jgi:alpha-tubulin suppressor-like RCC1 family protein
VRKGHERRLFAAISWRSAGLAAAVLLCGFAIWFSWPSSATAAGDAGRPGSGFGAGMAHSLAVKEDGTLWCWGVDGYDEDTGDYYPGMLVPTRVGTDTDWASAAPGPWASLAIKKDGSLWSVDFVIADDPGLSTTVVTTRVGSETDWVAITEGGLLSLALKADGTLWSVGYDLGADLEESWEPVFYADRVGEDDDWAAISAGAWTALALKTDGTLWSIEMTFDFGSIEDLDEPLDMETVFDVYSLSDDDDWAAVSTGGEHVLAIKTDGSLWAMGDNTYGQIGDGTTSTRDDFTRIGVQSDWVAVSAGLLHSLALKSDGTLWAWGRNEDGQVGDGATLDQHSPVRVGTMSDWMAVSAGFWHSLALDGDGTLWAWGDNQNAQLGDGTTEDRNRPIMVLSGVKLPDSAGQTVRFNDISASPYRAAIRSLAQRGIVSGFGDGSFRPDQPVSRQQFAKMIVLGLNLKVTEGGIPLSFVDVSNPTDDLYPDDYVAAAADKGLVQGYPDGSFRPLLDITRAQMLSIVVRAAQAFKPAALRTPPRNWVGGLSTVDPVHGVNVGIAEYSGLALGIDPGTFAIDGKATRGEIAQIIWNLRTK